ncbi:alpha-xenorhabdolysin family binary toxin subunit B [Pseudomonas sp. ZT5P21]
MTVFTFNNANNFDLPDRQVMKASQNHFNLAVAGKTFAFLPGVQEKTLYVRNQLNADDQQIGEDIRRVVASLSNVGFATVLMRIEEIQRTSTISPSVCEEKIDELVKYCSRRVASAQVPVDSAVHHLKQIVQNLDEISFSDVGTDLVRIESDRLARLRQSAARLTDDHEKLLLEKRTIDLQISQFNAPGWLDIFNKQIPGAAEIEAAIKLVATKKPDREFLELVLKRLKGNLEGIEEGRRYASLAEARDGVGIRLENARSELADIDTQMRDQGRKLEKLEAIGALDQMTGNWLREAEKVLAAYVQFSKTSQPQSIRDVQSIQLMAGSHEAMLNYLRQITWR